MILATLRRVSVSILENQKECCQVRVYSQSQHHAQHAHPVQGPCFAGKGPPKDSGGHLCGGFVVLTASPRGTPRRKPKRMTQDVGSWLGSIPRVHLYYYIIKIIQRSGTCARRGRGAGMVAHINKDRFPSAKGPFQIRLLEVLGPKSNLTILHGPLDLGPSEATFSFGRIRREFADEVLACLNCASQKTSRPGQSVKPCGIQECNYCPRVPKGPKVCSFTWHFKQQSRGDPCRKTLQSACICK